MKNNNGQTPFQVWALELRQGTQGTGDKRNGSEESCKGSMVWEKGEGQGRRERVRSVV